VPDPFGLNPDALLAQLSLTNHAVERYQQRFEDVPEDMRAARDHLRRRLEGGVLVVSATPPRDSRLARDGADFFVWHAHSGLTLPCVVDAEKRRPFVAKTVVDRFAADERKRAPRPVRRPAVGWPLRLLRWAPLAALAAWLLLENP
jgi:hypothetical protein